MTAKKILSIGFAPNFIDFSSPAMAPLNLTAEKVLAGLKAEEAHLKTLGYDVTICLVEPTEAKAEAAVRSLLSEKSYDCVCVGAGVRLNPQFTLIFERFINAIRELSPQATLCFNSKPTDTVAAFQRWA